MQNLNITTKIIETTPKHEIAQLMVLEILQYSYHEKNRKIKANFLTPVPPEELYFDEWFSCN